MDVPQVSHIDSVTDVSVAIHRRVSTTQTVQKPVNAPQIQFPDRVDNIPVVLQRQKPNPTTQVVDCPVPVTQVKTQEVLVPVAVPHVQIVDVSVVMS